MPRKKTDKKIRKPPILFIPFVVKIFLIWLGSITIFIFKIPLIISNILIKKISSLKIPKLPTFPKKKLPARGHILFKKSKFRKTWKKLPTRSKIAFLAFILIPIFLTYTTFLIQLTRVLPSPADLDSPTMPQTTEFYDRNGQLLYRLYDDRNRSPLKLTEIPDNLKHATIAIEDKNFYHHPGFDLASIFRAIYLDMFKKQTQGGSTITQQLVKNNLLSNEKTFQRKIKEVILAFWTEQLYNKDQILEMYLNSAPYGGQSWGVEAASQMYFGKSARDLDLAESAFLAGMPASPTVLSPYGTNPELGMLRKHEVLQRMVEEKYISSTQAQDAENEELNFKPLSSDIKAPHFVMYVRDVLSNRYGSKFVSQGGLKVITTLDLNLQEQTENIVKEEIEKLAPLNVTNGAAMVTDAKTGQILAMVGSRDYHYPGFGNYNSTIALRQAGSSIKPATYATAFKMGYSPGTTILDTPVSFNDGVNIYSPVNYDGRYHGPVSIRTALGSSYNIPAVKLLATVGVDKMIQTARDLGLTTLNEPKKYGLSLTLGAAEVKMTDMMSMYDTFSQNGLRHNTEGILKVTDHKGNVIEQFQDTPQRALQAEIAYMITSILSDNNARIPAFGPKSLLDVDGNKVAVKTGTSDNKRDNWTFGYSPDFVVGVWVGNPNNAPMNPALTSGVTGAAPIWNRITKLMLTQIPSNGFSKPSGIAEVMVDGRHDLGITGNIPKGLTRTKAEEDKTTFFDSFSVYATSSAQAQTQP